MTVALAGTEDHPQARMVLATALASGEPSHAYLFHGPGRNREADGGAGIRGGAAGRGLRRSRTRFARA